MYILKTVYTHFHRSPVKLKMNLLLGSVKRKMDLFLAEYLGFRD